ncbi:MAG: 2-hydroxyacyl-CoA dehydratase [Armatimonadetes bacterium]|nr:2-hydroxyacyl-CoA dehydratase [Armatimonadota bacterium]
MIQERLDLLQSERVTTIEKARSQGRKVVGYFPGGYVPEELIYASGAIPICLSHGGDARVADEGLSVLPHVICPFARAQVGEFRLRTNPFYRMVDLLVVPSTCQHIRKVADVVELFYPTPVFKLGVPYEPTDSFSLTFFKERLDDLRARLAEITGASVRDEAVVDAIMVYNRMRELLRSISLMRAGEGPAIRAQDFAALNHASFYADPVEMVEALGQIYHELLDTAADCVRDERPRLALVGPNLGYGDYDILDIVHDCGGNVVIEDIFEGIRDYWHTVIPAPDPVEALARSYLLDKTPRMFMRSSVAPRIEEVLRLTRDFRVAGIIWYQLVCCELYDEEAFFFDKRLQEVGLPMLTIEADYGGLRAGAVRTRVEAFVELLQGGMVDA